MDEKERNELNILFQKSKKREVMTEQERNRYGELLKKAYKESIHSKRNDPEDDEFTLLHPCVFRLPDKGKN